MSGNFILRKTSWVKSMRRLTGIAVAFAIAGLAARAQAPAQIRAKITVADDCTAFAWAPNGRIAYSTKHVLETKKLDIERDDIWILEKDGGRHKIFSGDKFNREGGAFSYTITGLRWSPDSSRIAAELHVSQIPTSRGDEQDSQVLLLLDYDGHELPIQGGNAMLGRAADGAWLADAGTLAYTSGAGRGNPLFSLHLLKAHMPRGNDLFTGHTFASVAWDATNNSAVAVERTNAFDSPARITLLDLLHEDGRALTTLESYSGGLAISAAADKIAYFLNSDTLEIRDVTSPDRTARIRCDYGEISWSPDGTKLLIKQGQERRDGDLEWITVPPLTEGTDGAAENNSDPKSFLTGVLFRQAAISPDGKFVGAIETGKRNLLIYDAPQ
jgi:hypothetical protein